MLPRRRGRHTVRRLACWSLAACLGNACVATTTGNGASGTDTEKGYELDLAARTATQTIGPEVGAPQTKKFVQVEVARVVNPAKVPLAFTVHFQPLHGEKLYLGTFSLYPPDNPGKFIVATRGKLRTGGTVIVSLVPLERVSGRERISVQLKRITFLAP